MSKLLHPIQAWRRRARRVPSPEVQWKVVRVLLLSVTMSVVGFAVVIAVLHHQGSEKRHDLCDRIAQFGDDFTNELAKSFKADPNGVPALEFKAHLRADLKGCG